MKITYETYKERREKLARQTQGSVLLIGGFENSRTKFQQDSSFYYYTGVKEPGAFCLIEQNGTAHLYLPTYTTDRSVWIPGALTVSPQTATDYGFASVAPLGAACKGYSMPDYFTVDMVSGLIEALQALVATGTRLGVIQPSYYLDHLARMVPGLAEIWFDITGFVGAMRRCKSQDEIEALYNAIDVTMIAHEAAAQAIGSGKNESQVAAAIAYVFAESAAEAAFPSIVGSGVNATVLHYTDNNRYMNNDELVIVDAGARLEMYCGDLTRTYPVSGTFTARQKELYSAVLETQQHLAALAQPGWWLRNDEIPEKSLYHEMVKCLRERGLEKYIQHGVGHFLGLDVHDVGNTKEPLREGDVITIEPGIYIPEEAMGIRIEDNYWIIEGGVVCLSEALPSSIEAIEEMSKKVFEV